MTDGISSTVLMEPMKCVAMLDQLTGTNFHRLPCHSNLLTQKKLQLIMHAVLCALITEQLVPLASGGLPGQLASWIFIWGREVWIELSTAQWSMLFPVMMAVLSYSDCQQQTGQGAIAVFQHAWGWLIEEGNSLHNTEVFDNFWDTRRFSNCHLDLIVLEEETTGPSYLSISLYASCISIHYMWIVTWNMDVLIAFGNLENGPRMWTATTCIMLPTCILCIGALHVGIGFFRLAQSWQVWHYIQLNVCVKSSPVSWIALAVCSGSCPPQVAWHGSSM